MKLIIFFYIAAIYTTFFISAEEDVKSITTKARWGVEAGTAIFNALGADKVSSAFGSIGKIAGQIAPFLGAIGPALHLLTLFIPTGPSPEMVYMRKQFAIIDAKFGQVFNRFDEVKHLIEKESLRNMYSNDESKIKDMSHLLTNFHNSTEPTNIKFWKAKFLETYSTSLEESTRRLWRGMTERSDFSRNIPLSVLEYTENHRLKTQNTMKGVTNLILRGAQIIVTYNELTGNINGSRKEQAYWDGKMKELIQTMQNVDETAVSNFKTQYVKDIDKKLSDMYGVPDKTFVDTLFDFLDKKYDWRDWFVLTFKWHNHLKAKETCDNALLRSKVHGRSLYVVSVDSYKGAVSRPRTFNAITHLNYENCRYGCWYDTTWNKDAVTLYNRLSDFYKNDCWIPGVIFFNGFSNNENYKTSRYYRMIKDVRNVYGDIYTSGKNYVFMFS